MIGLLGVGGGDDGIMRGTVGVVGVTTVLGLAVDGAVDGSSCWSVDGWLGKAGTRRGKVAGGEGMIWCKGAGDGKGIMVCMATEGEISGS